MICVEKIINKIFDSNTYVISADGSQDVWLVDVGDVEKVLSILPAGTKVRGVFLTHTHFDHLYGINLLYDFFPDLTVYVAVEGVDGLYSAKKNLSKYHETPLEFKGSKVIGLRDGDDIEIYPSVHFRVISTPGHTPDSMSFILENDYLFTGDAYIPTSSVVSKLPGGDKKTAEISKRMLIGLSHDRILMPGHGDILRNKTNF